MPDRRILLAGLGLAVVTVACFAGVLENDFVNYDDDLYVTDRPEIAAGLTGETVAWAKVLISETDDSILGAHMIGHAGEELIHLFALAMKHGITAGQIKDSVFGFPTFSADIKNLL